MSRAQLPLVIGVVLAVVIPAAVLELCAGEARLAAEMSAAPFAWRRVLIAHLLAALPLGLTCAAWLRTRPAVASSPRWPWLVLGLAAALAVAAASATCGEALARSGAGPTPLLLLRALVALVLVVPWCLASLDPLPKENTPVPAPRGIVFLAGLGLAVVPCGMYAAAVTAARTDEAAQLVNQRRLARAQWVATGLCELGSERRVGMRSPAQLRSWLAATLQGLRRQAEQPIATSPSEADRVSRAVLFVQLERLDEAAAILEPLVPADDTATLILAAICRDQRRSAPSDALYTAIVDRQLPRVGTDEAARAACRTAFDGLAENARNDHRPRDAEAALDRGLRELPADAAYFHLQLGRHYHDVGRIGLAVEHLETAVRLDRATFEAPAGDLIRQIRTATPGCFSGIIR